MDAIIPGFRFNTEVTKLVAKIREDNTRQENKQSNSVSKESRENKDEYYNYLPKYVLQPSITAYRPSSVADGVFVQVSLNNKGLSQTFKVPSLCVKESFRCLLMLFRLIYCYDTLCRNITETWKFLYPDNDQKQQNKAAFFYPVITASRNLKEKTYFMLKRSFLSCCKMK